MSTIKIRVMQEEDMPAVAAIQSQVLGTRRHDYKALKARAMTARSPIMPLVAEVGNEIVGFVMGETSDGEYGVPGTIGWIDSIGVLSNYQRQGVARMLVEELIASMCRVGVCKVYTLVNWRDGDMLGFFDKLGFTNGDMINLERKV
ncbi:MAG: GNAT family N-acetyltransferase [Chloroflexi bacterium]|nr:GNAT family N-acetyltransferase [Chloroflexota bacterium]